MARKINHDFEIGGQKFVVFRKKDWDRFTDMLAELPDPGVEAAGGCAEFCASECAHSGGCRRSWMTSGGCGAMCTNGDIFI